MLVSSAYGQGYLQEVNNKPSTKETILLNSGEKQNGHSIMEFRTKMLPKLLKRCCSLSLKAFWQPFPEMLKSIWRERGLSRIRCSEPTFTN